MNSLRTLITGPFINVNWVLGWQRIKVFISLYLSYSDIHLPVAPMLRLPHPSRLLLIFRDATDYSLSAINARRSTPWPTIPYDSPSLQSNILSTQSRSQVICYANAMLSAELSTHCLGLPKEFGRMTCIYFQVIEFIIMGNFNLVRDTF